MRKLFFLSLLVVALFSTAFGQQKIKFENSVNFLDSTAKVEALVAEQMPQVTSETRDNLIRQVNTQYLPMFKIYYWEDSFVSAFLPKIQKAKEFTLKSPLVQPFEVKFVDSEEISEIAKQAIASGNFTLTKEQILNAMAEACAHNGTVFLKTKFAEKISFQDAVAILAHEVSHSQDEQIKKLIALQLKKEGAITESEYQDYKIRLEVMCDLKALQVLQTLKAEGASISWLVDASKKWMFENREKQVRVELAEYHAQIIQKEAMASK